MSRHHLLLLACSFYIALAGFSVSYGQQQDENDTLLIMGNLIGRISLPSDTPPETTITAYYALIAHTRRSELESIHNDLRRRTEDYLVAFRAGDTAEINEVVDTLVLYWAAIRSIHIQTFTPDVVDLLESAYAEIYPFIESRR